MGRAERGAILMGTLASATGRRRTVRSSRCAAYVPIATLLIVSALAGCSAAPGGMCTDDSQQCVAQRQERYKALTSDASHGWTATPPDALEFASAVRLFAYREQHSAMSCDSLQRGIAETASARLVLRSDAAQSVSAERRGQVIALSDDINVLLTRTHAKRCRS